MWNEVTYWTNTAAAFATALGIFAVIYQLRLSLKQNQVEFENQMTKEYRSILQAIDYRAMFNETLEGPEREKARNEIYNYVDLCNEQVFLAMQGKVAPSTWLLWRDGIRTNLERPLFAELWKEIQEKDPLSFHELRDIVSRNYPDNIRNRWLFGWIIR